MGMQIQTVNLDTVATIMRTRGVSQSAFARTLSLVPGSVRAKLAGRIRFSADEIATLAKMCNVPMETFFQPVTIDIRPSAIVGEDIPGYDNQGLLPGVLALKRVA